MNATHTDPRLAAFVSRLLQSAAGDIKTPAPTSAHDLAMAYRAAFASLKA
jgi:hypothetical protein